MEFPVETADIAVVVGRFQVAKLHDGHRELIDWVAANFDKYVLVLGCAPIPCTHNDPLDFESRKLMIQEDFPRAIVLPLSDCPTNDEWSRELDKVVRTIKGPQQSVVLCGSRDSFISSYEGRFRTLQLEASMTTSGTEQRDAIARLARDSEDFRAGVIWASRQRFPVAFHTVDMAIFNDDYTKIVLGRKPGEKYLRFPGGFVDPTNDGSDADAIREAKEETSLDLTKVEFVGSYPIDDWRYRGGPDGVKTSLYAGVGCGILEAADDLESAEWYDLSILDPETTWQIMPAHRELGRRAYMYAKTKAGN